MIDQLRPGDVVVVTKYDRLSRSLQDLLGIVARAFAALSQDMRLQALRHLVAAEPDGLTAGEIAAAHFLRGAMEQHQVVEVARKPSVEDLSVGHGDEALERLTEGIFFRDVELGLTRQSHASGRAASGQLRSDIWGSASLATLPVNPKCRISEFCTGILP